MVMEIDLQSLTLEQILLESGIVTEDQITQAVQENEINNKGLLYNLVSLGLVSEDVLVQELSGLFDVPEFLPDEFTPSYELVDLIGVSTVFENQVFPIKQEDNSLTVALLDPTHLQVIDTISYETGLKVNPVIATPNFMDSQILNLKSQVELGNIDAKVIEEISLDEEELDFDSTMVDPLSAPIEMQEKEGEDESLDAFFETSADEAEESFSNTSNVSPPKYKEAESDELTTIAVYYATDRLRDVSATSVEDYYLGKRNDSGELNYGRCSVSIPKDHRIGHVERPSWLRLEFSENPKKHISVVKVAEYSNDEFYQDIDLYLTESSTDSALIFVHGYNVSFYDAVLRTAQIGYDLNFNGPTLCYSWPSTATVKGYLTDANNVRWSEPHFKKFLLDLHTLTGVTSINIIAHSMGSRLLAASLEDIADQFESDQVIFAAPDVDADVFKELTSGFHHRVNRITLYASSNDEALKLSRSLQGDYARAGETTSGVKVYPNVDSIDATKVNTGFLGHSYYGENRSIVSDIYHLFRENLSPNDRFGMHEKSNNEGGIYWEFRP